MKVTSVFYILLLTVVSQVLSAEDQKFSVAFQWNYLNFTWPSNKVLRKSSYKPGTDEITGIKIYKNVVYLSLPRVKNNARVTLASISINAPKINPLLAPYPNWHMNSGSSCDVFQDVMSMDIDTDGIMWVIDTRRSDNSTNCPPKIVFLDLNNHGKVIKTYIVPDALCPYKHGCFLNDIVIDGDYAYLSDFTKSDPGIFVYNRKTDQAWKVRDRSVFGDPEARRFVAQGVETTDPKHINGIALSADCAKNRTFYFMPQSSLHIYSIPTHILKDKDKVLGDPAWKFIKDEGTKQAQSGGMICDSKNVIYYTLLPLDAIGKWETKESLEKSTLLEQNHDIIKWPDSLAFDGNGNMYVVSNSNSKFNQLGINTKEINFRVLKIYTGTKSYIYCDC